MYWLAAALLMAAANAAADGTAIDRVYHPYVQPLEQELEMRAILESDTPTLDGRRRVWRLGYGRSFGDRWFGEAYLVGANENGGNFKATGYEIEGLWQATEQGRYFADFGLLFEFEKAYDGKMVEVLAALLMEKEWGRAIGTVNLKAIYEFGDDVDAELETALAAQARYRYARQFEPAMELYAGQNTLGAGPVVVGSRLLGGPRRLRWEFGSIFGLRDDTPDVTARALVEFEF